MSSVMLPGGELVITRELVEVHYLSDQDHGWKFTDAAGHHHAWAAGGGEWPSPANYPTLKIVVDEIYWCGDCRDEHTHEHLECVQCGERIYPGTTGPGTIYVDGPVTITYNGEEISQEQADQLIAEYRRQKVREGVAWARSRFRST
jgi:hypothetical protein